MKPTKHTCFIPKTPDVRPKQRLNEVVGHKAKVTLLDYGHHDSSRIIRLLNR